MNNMPMPISEQDYEYLFSEVEKWPFSFQEIVKAFQIVKNNKSSLKDACIYSCENALSLQDSAYTVLGLTSK